MSLYLVPAALACILTILFLYLVQHRKIITHFDQRSGQRHNAKMLLRVGGIAMSAAFLITLFVDQNFVIDHATRGFLWGIVLLVSFGFWDDIRELSWKAQLGFHVAIGGFLFLHGIAIDLVTNPFGGVIYFETGAWLIVSFFATLAWIVTVINALNWADGMHGLAGGVSVIAGATLFLLALRPEVYQPPVAIIAAVFVAVTLVFTCVNIFGGKVIAGTTGSSFMGYIIAVLAIFAGAKIGTALLVMIVPLIDALFVVSERWQRGVSIFSPDTRHLHHRLRAAGWSEKKILTAYCGLTCGGAVLALTTQSVSKFLVLVLYSTIIFATIAYIHSRTRAL